MCDLHDKKGGGVKSRQIISWGQGYYCGDNGLYRVRIDGSGYKNLNDDMCGYIAIVDGWIYYSNESDGGKLYRRREDGSDRKKLNNHKSEYIKIAGKWLYYCFDKRYDYVRALLNDPLYGHRLPRLDGEWKDSKQHVIYRIRVDGRRRRRVCYGFDFDVGEDGWVSFWNYDTSNTQGGCHRYRIRANGWGRPKLADPPKAEAEAIVSSCAVDGWIYYLSHGWRSLNFRELPTNHLYRMREDGSERTKISSHDFSELGTANKAAFYSITHTTWHRGTEFEERTEYFMMHLVNLKSELLYEKKHPDDWWDYYVDYHDYS